MRREIVQEQLQLIAANRNDATQVSDLDKIDALYRAYKGKHQKSIFVHMGSYMVDRIYARFMDLKTYFDFDQDLYEFYPNDTSNAANSYVIYYP